MDEERDEPEETSGEAEQRDPPQVTWAELTTAATRGLAGGEAGVVTAMALRGGPFAQVFGAFATTAVTVESQAAPLVLRKLMAQWRRRRESALRATASELNTDMGALEQRIANSEKGLDLFTRVVDAAVRTPLEEKITALGRVLAEGLQDDGNFDEAFMLAAALADMEAPHVEALNYIGAHSLPPVELRTNSAEPRGWTTDQLAKALPKLARMIDGVIPVLSGHGPLKDIGGQLFPGGVGPDQWAITDLAATVWTY